MRQLVISIITFITLALLIGLFTYSISTDQKPEKSYYDAYKSDYKIFSPPLPKDAIFAGENAPLEIYYVSEKLEKEILVNTYWHSNTLLLFKRANRWLPVINPILKKNNIPSDFVYLALIESGLTQAVSPAGARGFWQLMKPTAISYGLTVNSEIDERYHVEKATQIACDYLNEAYAKFGSWTLAAASYNMGMGGLNKQLDLQKVSNYYDLSLNSETGRYVYRILALKTIFSNPSKYGFQLRETDLYPELETTDIVVDTIQISWADFAKSKSISYQMLKELNPWLLTPTLSNSKREKLIIKIPRKSMYDYAKLRAALSDKLGVFGEKKER